MKYRIIALALAGCLLCACSAQSQSAASASSAASAASSESAAQSAAASESQSAASEEEILIDPPYDFDPEQMQPSDFGDYFTQSYETKRSSYPLLEGDEYQNEVTVLTGAEPGPVIYVVAGVHGDETAGWSTGDLLKKIDIKAGTLYILSPANRWGASADPRTRYVTGKEDLNRSFPGNPDGGAAERVADAIMKDITEKQPEFVFDLHEARVKADNRDFLGSSLIYTDLAPFGDLFLDLMTATQSGELCSEPFNFYAPGPAGSINSTVTNTLHLPVLTVETYRGYPLERRIGDQLDIVQYVLAYYEMI